MQVLGTHKFLSGWQSVTGTYEIEDGTGSIEAYHWLDHEESDWLVSERAKWEAPSYVRVVGNIRTAAGSDKKSISAYSLRKITDYNEVTYHFLDAVHTHLYNTQGPKGSGPPAGGSHFSPPGKPSSGPGGGAALGGAAGEASSAVAYAAPVGGAGGLPSLHCKPCLRRACHLVSMLLHWRARLHQVRELVRDDGVAARPSAPMLVFQLTSLVSMSLCRNGSEGHDHRRVRRNHRQRGRRLVGH